MDNHTGDWLYYIVILVVAIVSFVGNLNKKKPQEQTLPPASQPPSMEEMQPSPPPPPPVWTRKKKSPPSMSESRWPSSASLSPGMEEGRRMLDGEMQALVEEKETAWTDELDLTNRDAFRRAFVSAEILNRKY
ncbi:MAG: hypothetical protein LBJ01_03190 [Tannerella sp.]|nr:hypothetical protein [Tannerella sp.]